MEVAPESGLPPQLEGVHADVPGRGKGSGDSRIRVRDQGIPDNKGIGVCCAPKQIKGLDCLGPWGMGLRTRSCRKVKNAILEAPGNSQNNPGTHWNLAVQRRNCPAENSTILEGCEISRGIFRPLCEINLVRNFLERKIPGAKPPPPPLYINSPHPHHCSSTVPRMYHGNSSGAWNGSPQQKCDSPCQRHMQRVRTKWSRWIVRPACTICSSDAPMPAFKSEARVSILMAFNVKGQ